MKNLPVLALFILLVGNVCLFAAENVAVWERIYQTSFNDEQRYSVMLKIMEFKDKSFAPMVQQSLDALYSRRIEFGTQAEQTGKINLARLCVQELGNLKNLESADTVFRIYKEVKNTLLKADAAVALGKMRAISYAEQLSRDLADLNLKPDAENPRHQEIVAYGLVQSLEFMRSPLAYEPVFLASVGWYSPASRVKELSRKVLAVLVEDPSESLKSIIKDNKLFEVRLAALEACEASKAKPENKAAVARQALAIGVDSVASDVLKTADIAKLRIKAMQILIAVADKDPVSASLLKQVVGLDKGNDVTFDETMTAYSALGFNGSELAVKVLIAQLENYNARQRQGANTAREKSFVKEIIAAMKRTASPLTKESLLATQFIETYDAQILRDAREAAK